MDPPVDPVPALEAEPAQDELGAQRREERHVAIAVLVERQRRRAYRLPCAERRRSVRRALHGGSGEGEERVERAVIV